MEKTLKRLIESVTLSKETIKKIPLQESTSIVESADGKEHKALAVYTVDISRYDNENLNGRVYTKKLWENVINKQRHLYEGSVGLQDHPEGEGSSKDIFCVWHNLRMNESTRTIKADMYLVGRRGQDVNAIIEAGGKVGLSTSGFGELKEDKKTVNEETFEIERVADFVLNPSQSVYAKKEDFVESVNNEEIKNNSDVENITINNIEEKTKKDETMNNTTNIPIPLLRKNIESYFESAIKVKDINEKLEAFKEIESWLKDANTEALNDLSESVQSEIKAILEKKEELSIKGQKTDKLEEELSQVKKVYEDYEKKYFEAEAKLELTYETLDKLKEYGNTYKEMFDVEVGKKNTMVEAEDFVKVKKENQELEEAVESFKLKLVEKDEKIASLKTKFEEYVKNIEKEKIEEQNKIRAYEKEKEFEKIKIQKELEEKEKLDNIKRLEEEAKKEEELNYLQQRTEVKEYFEDLCNTHSRKVMEEYKDSILACRTLEEAQIRYFRLRKEIDSLEESLAETDKSLYESLHSNANRTVYRPQKPKSRLL